MSLLPGRFYLDDFFNDFEPEKKVMNMNCDIYEKEGKYNIVMDIPGFDKKDVKIEVEDGYLTISAHKSEKHEDKDKHYIKRERYSGSFKREFYIGLWLITRRIPEYGVHYADLFWSARSRSLWRPEIR